MSNDIVILGAGGFARETYEITLDEGKYNMVGWIVDPNYIDKVKISYGFPVYGFEWLEGKRGKVSAIPAVGASEVRRRMMKKCEKYGIEFVNAIHPSVQTSRWATIGEGVVLCPHDVIRNECVIGNGVQVNMNCVVGHDAILGEYSTLAMGVQVTGGCVIGEGTYVGSGVTFSSPKKVGKWCRIGSGASITTDIPDNATAVGVPAKVVRMREEGWQE